MQLGLKALCLILILSCCSLDRNRRSDSQQRDLVRIMAISLSRALLEMPRVGAIGGLDLRGTGSSNSFANGSTRPKVRLETNILSSAPDRGQWRGCSLAEDGGIKPLMHL